MGMEYRIEEYITASGKSPYAEWVNNLRDVVAKSKAAARVDRAAHGNFGDWKSIAGAKGIYEMRINYGPGYRIYYGIVQQKIILLLAGSIKKDQDRTIAKAMEYMADYERRVRK
jgi:putative addiction module killer protein